MASISGRDTADPRRYLRYLAVNFEPFLEEGRPNKWASWPELDVTASLSVAGKVMAYAAFGSVDEELLARFRASLEMLSGSSEAALLEFVRIGRAYGGSSADLLATYQVFLGDALCKALIRQTKDSAFRSPNLCFSGGCALNVVWNQQLRTNAGFERMWVPPFPNDPGSALGAACCEMVSQGFGPALRWQVYSGPQLGRLPTGGVPCSLSELAQLLHSSGDPIVVMHGRAELGPRALGHRSILAPCTDSAMQDRLNQIKQREPFRPIAPVCLESRAGKIFEPGVRDPYMLFAHRVRPDWALRIPAVTHVDGSARLQTVSDADDPLLAQLLLEYEGQSGVPVLCNTSANGPGTGFFPDVQSAIEWGQVRWVWAEGRLFESGSAPSGTN